MPELPEVEVVRLFLASKLQDKTIVKIEIINPKSFVGSPELVEGQTIISFKRVGKQLSLFLQNGLILLFHLKMTGQVIYIDKTKTILGHPTKDSHNSLPNKSTRVIFTFSDNSCLYFNDQRKFGWVKVLSQTELAEAQKHLGHDILALTFTDQYFYQQLQKTSRAIKLALLDQALFAGIGNIYANDALFLSKIHPLTPAKNITFQQSSLLRKKLIQIMKDSIQQGGSTAKDHGYVKPDGQFGQHQFHFQVYQREGEPCFVCCTPITRIKLGGRSAFFCSHCQKSP